MNLFQIFSDIEKIDGDAPERLAYYSRRNWLKMSKRVTAAVAAPTVLAASLNDAYAQSSAAVAALNFALTLEYLEDEYYRTAIGTSGLIPASDLAIMGQISKHEIAHVALLKGALGSAAVAKPTFKFGTVFSSYQTFLSAAQAFEDTGVRAYKGQAGALLGTDLLTVALQIHSVEARHAAEVRRLRGLRGWVTEGDTGAVYAGEELTTQAGVDLMSLTGKSSARARESFDEPLTREQVLAIVTPYLA
ncbi:ferritin-like domain-containing protein [Fibrivirga algicola]|uniref:Ferritin-like domain-containing protein n=1 Tax=Fibrivirga algicola TaxID=2950420 RepID=A0ABX0QJ84_9BACT|nr:ferritin-like domain-containing protein [Fibrivirga algicola]NID11888.1 ferritin-like domain-containing protein [Fibrivirga algicola]